MGLPRVAGDLRQADGPGSFIAQGIVSDMRRSQAEKPKRRTWHGVRAGVLIAASTSLLTLAVFAAVAKVVSQDHGWLSSSEAPSARVAQVHDLAGQNPLLTH